MTFEEKIKEILGNKLNGDLPAHQETITYGLRKISEAIERGDLEEVKELLPKLEKGYVVMRKLLTLATKGKKIGAWESTATESNYHVCFSNGKWSFGTFCWGKEGLTDKYLLKVSRLLRDAEVRCLKHPRHRQI